VVRAAADLVFGDVMTVVAGAQARPAAAPLVFGDGMTVETDAAATLAAALVFGDGMTVRIFISVNFGSHSNSYVNLRYALYYETADNDDAINSNL
jgi:hypothetical protein